MKEKEKLITVLNQILIDELKTVDQNMFCAKANENLDCEEIERESNEELKQAEWLIKRILFLEVYKSHEQSIRMCQNVSKNNFEREAV